MSRPFISIGIPTYNRANYLKQCLESCLNQNYEHYEIIVIDDASTDETPKVVEEFKKRSDKIKFIRLEKNTQGRHVWLPFLKEARGDYYLSLGDDDYLQTNVLPLYAEAVERYKADIIYGDLMAVNEKGEVFDHYKYVDWYLKNRELKKALFFNCCLPDPGCMIRAKVHHEKWFQKKDFSFIPWQQIEKIISKVGDYFRWILLSDTCIFKHLGIAPIFYRIHSGSDSIPKLKDWSEESFVRRLMLCLYPKEEIFFDLDWSGNREKAEAEAYFLIGKVLMMQLDLYNASRFFYKALNKKIPSSLASKILEELLLCLLKFQTFVDENKILPYFQQFNLKTDLLTNAKQISINLKLQSSFVKVSMAKGDFEKAENILKGLKETIGHSALRSHELGLLYQKLEKFEKAYGYLRYALIMNPLNEIYYKDALETGCQLGREEEIKMVRRRLLIQPSDLIENLYPEEIIVQSDFNNIIYLTEQKNKIAPRAQWIIRKKLKERLKNKEDWLHFLTTFNKPKVVGLSLTSKCSLKCKHCAPQRALHSKFHINHSKKHISQEELDFLVSQLEGVERVMIAGYGESTLCPLIFKAIQDIKLKVKEVGLTTHGVFPDVDILPKLKTAGLDTIVFSLEGADESSYEYIRGKGTYEIFLQNFKKAVSLFPKVQLNIIICKETLSSLSHLPQLLERIKPIQAIAFNLLRWENLLEGVSLPSYGELETTLLFLKDRLSKLEVENNIDYLLGTLRKKGKISHIIGNANGPCWLPFTSIAIGTLGEWRICVSEDAFLEPDAFTHSLEEIFNHEFIKEVRWGVVTGCYNKLCARPECYATLMGKPVEVKSFISNWEPKLFKNIVNEIRNELNLEWIWENFLKNLLLEEIDKRFREFLVSC